MQYARRRDKRKPVDKPKLIYETIVAILVLAVFIYTIVTGDVPDTSEYYN